MTLEGVEMNGENNLSTSYEEEDYLSIWLCKTESEENLFKYVEKEYEDSGETKFQLGLDFNISWYDEDFFEASFRENIKSWNFIKGHSYVESILLLLKGKYQEVINNNYNGVIIFYNFKYNGDVVEVKNEKYGYFKFVGTFKYQR